MVVGGGEPHHGTSDGSFMTQGFCTEPSFRSLPFPLPFFFLSVFFPTRGTPRSPTSYPIPFPIYPHPLLYPIYSSCPLPYLVWTHGACTSRETYGLVIALPHAVLMGWLVHSRAPHFPFLSSYPHPLPYTLLSLYPSLSILYPTPIVWRSMLCVRIDINPVSVGPACTSRKF